MVFVIYMVLSHLSEYFGVESCCMQCFRFKLENCTKTKYTEIENCNCDEKNIVNYYKFLSNGRFKTDNICNATVDTISFFKMASFIYLKIYII